MTLNDFSQFVIAVCSTLAVLLLQSRQRGVRGIGCALGLMAQPYWLYETWHSNQWGMFTAAVAFTAVWARGIYLNWGQPT